MPVCLPHTYDASHRAKVHRHPLHLGAVYSHLCNITCVFHHIPLLALIVLFTNRTCENMVCYSLPLVIGLYFTCLLYQVMASTEITLALSLLVETEARGEMQNQRDNQPFLPLHLRSSEESQQGREREELTPNSCLVVLLANGDTRSESTTGQKSSLY